MRILPGSPLVSKDSPNDGNAAALHSVSTPHQDGVTRASLELRQCCVASRLTSIEIAFEDAHPLPDRVENFEEAAACRQFADKPPRARGELQLQIIALPQSRLQRGKF